MYPDRVRIFLWLSSKFGLRKTIAFAALENPVWRWFVLSVVRAPYSDRRVRRRLRHIRCDLVDSAKVSFVIPNNNGVAFGLERLIRSIQAQTHPNIEIIAVDSGSTDNSVELMNSLGVTVIEISPHEFNHAFSRNTGAAAATGEYLVFTVSDAEFHDSNWVREGIALLKAFDAASYSTPQGYSGAEPYAKFLASCLNSRFPSKVGITVTRPNIIPAGIIPSAIVGTVFGVDDTNHMVEKKVFEKILFQSQTVEDMDFGKRLYRAGKRLILSNRTNIQHFHSYTNLNKYFARVYTDSLVIQTLGGDVMPFWDRPDELLLACGIVEELIQREWGAFCEYSGNEGLSVQTALALARTGLSGGLSEIRLDLALMQDAAHAFESISALRAVNDYELRENEFHFLRGRALKALTASFDYFDRIGHSSMSLDHCARVLHLLMVNIVAVELAKATPSTLQTEHEGFRALRELKWQ